MTTPEQIDIWRQTPSEHQRLEFKEAKTQFDNRRLYEYCVAIANEGGGHLLLGIADKPPRPVVGTQAFNDPIAMAEKLFQALGFRVDIEEVMHPQGRVVVFHIPSRPHGTAYHFGWEVLDARGRGAGADERRPVAADFCRGQTGLAGRTHANGP
jgi:predicted HTH transcriptional regulator